MTDLQLYLVMPAFVLMFLTCFYGVKLTIVAILRKKEDEIHQKNVVFYQKKERVENLQWNLAVHYAMRYRDGSGGLHDPKGKILVLQELFNSCVPKFLCYVFDGENLNLSEAEKDEICHILWPSQKKSLYSIIGKEIKATEAELLLVDFYLSTGKRFLLKSASKIADPKKTEGNDLSTGLVVF